MFRAKVGLSLTLIALLHLDGFGQCGSNGSINLNDAASFSISDRGAAIYDTNGSGSSLTTGYAQIEASGGAAPAGYLAYSLKKNGVVVSRTTVPEVHPMTAGRLYAAYYGRVNTGVAMVNTSSFDAVVKFYFSPGFASCDCPNPEIGTLIIPPHSQIARFINEAPFNVSFGPSVGTLTFSSSQRIGVIALLGHTNERGEFLMTTLPIYDFEDPVGGDVVFLPHYADGAGWTTQVILVNPTDATLTGTVQFLGPGGATARYTIPGRVIANIATPGAQSTVTTGAVRVIPDAGTFSPSGLAIFTFTNNGIVVSEAGVPVLRPAQAFRMVDIECAQAGNQTETGIAVANPSPTDPAAVMLDVTDASGNPTPWSSTLLLPPLAHFAAFMKQLPGLRSIPDSFEGVVRIQTTSGAGIAVIGLRGEYNARNDFLITTSMPVNEATAASSSVTMFPHLAVGDGYETEFVLFSGSTGQTSAGQLDFFSQSGAPLN